MHTYIEGKTPTSLQGCIKILMSNNNPKLLPLHSNNKPNMPGKLPYSDISNTTKHKLTNVLKQRMCDLGLTPFTSKMYEF